MGADVHMILEEYDPVQDTWVGTNDYDVLDFYMYHTDSNKQGRYDYSWPKVTSRNYAIFAKLAGVRGEGPEPKGPPQDSSTLTKMKLDQWGYDAHSVTWYYLEDMVRIVSPHYLKDDVFDDDREDLAYRLFTSRTIEARANPTHFRVVVWFDN